MKNEERMKSRGWEDNRRALFTIHFSHVNSKLGRQHTKLPLAAALSPFKSLLYQPNPWCEWYDVWRLTTTPESTSPTLFEKWCGVFFYAPQELDKCKCCDTRPTVFRPYPRISTLFIPEYPFDWPVIPVGTYSKYRSGEQNIWNKTE